VQLIGVVVAVSEGQGFVLVDQREYADCGLNCLAEPCQLQSVLEIGKGKIHLERREFKSLVCFRLIPFCGGIGRFLS
jgi:hypothetical protein